MYVMAAPGVGALGLGLVVPGGSLPFVIARWSLLTAGALFLVYVVVLGLLVAASSAVCRRSASDSASRPR